MARSKNKGRLRSPSYLTKVAVHAVKPENVATFLGRKLHPMYQDEFGNDFHTRIEGTRIKHHMGPAAIKMYDKHALVLRIETTANDVSFFKHYREVEHRDGTRERKPTPMQKTIYSLGALRELLTASNRRYLEFLSELVDPSSGLRAPGSGRSKNSPRPCANTSAATGASTRSISMILTSSSRSAADSGT